MANSYNPFGSKTTLADIVGGFGDFMQQMQMMKMIKQMFPEQETQALGETPLPQGRMVSPEVQQQQFNPFEVLGQAPPQFGQQQQFGPGQQFGGGQGELDINQIIQMLSRMGMGG